MTTHKSGYIEQTQEDQAGFNDSALNDAVASVDWRTPEQQEDDTQWIETTTAGIIQRRKDRQHAERERSDQSGSL